jgi:hypothetical protein
MATLTLEVIYEIGFFTQLVLAPLTEEGAP